MDHPSASSTALFDAGTLADLWAALSLFGFGTATMLAAIFGTC